MRILLYVALGGCAGFLFNVLFFMVLTKVYPEAVGAGRVPAGIAISGAIGLVVCTVTGALLGGARAARHGRQPP